MFLLLDSYEIKHQYTATNFRKNFFLVLLGTIRIGYSAIILIFHHVPFTAYIIEVSYVDSIRLYILHAGMLILSSCYAMKSNKHLCTSRQTCPDLPWFFVFCPLQDFLVVSVYSKYVQGFI